MIAIDAMILEVELNFMDRKACVRKNKLTLDKILVMYNIHKIDTKTRERANNGTLRISTAE
jgi:hypothetical protein